MGAHSAVRSVVSRADHWVAQWAAKTVALAEKKAVLSVQAQAATRAVQMVEWWAATRVSTKAVRTVHSTEGWTVVHWAALRVAKTADKMVDSKAGSWARCWAASTDTSLVLMTAGWKVVHWAHH